VRGVAVALIDQNTHEDWGYSMYILQTARFFNGRTVTKTFISEFCEPTERVRSTSEAALQHLRKNDVLALKFLPVWLPIHVVRLPRNLMDRLLEIIHKYLNAQILQLDSLLGSFSTCGLRKCRSTERWALFSVSSRQNSLHL
jgi:hypothetical protein